MSKEFANKTNEELCALVARLKFQLLEARFRMATGEIEKLNVISDVKKTIARILTELTLRGFKVTIGAHGIALYDLKTNQVKIINNAQIEAINQKEQKLEQAKQEKTKPAKKAEKVQKLEVIEKTSQPELKEKTPTSKKKTDAEIDMGENYEGDARLSERGAALTSEIPLVDETKNIEDLEKK